MIFPWASLLAAGKVDGPRIGVVQRTLEARRQCAHLDRSQIADDQARADPNHEAADNDHPPAELRPPGTGVAQLVFSFLKLRPLAADYIHEALAFQVHRDIGIFGSLLPEIDHQLRMFLPLGVALVDLRKPALLARVIGDHPLKRLILGFEVLAGFLVRQEKSEIAGDEISAETGLHIQNQVEQAAAGGRHPVAVVHPLHGPVHVIGLQQQHCCQHCRGQQRQQHSPA